MKGCMMKQEMPFTDVVQNRCSQKFAKSLFNKDAGLTRVFH